MALAVVQQANGVDNAGAGGTVSGVFGSNITAGNAILVIQCMSDTTAALFNKEMQAPTDTRGNKYYLIGSTFDATFGVGMEAWVAYNSTAGANTVAATDNGNDAEISVYELSGVPYFGLDQSVFTIMASNATFTTGNITTTKANALLMAGFASGLSAWVAGASYSNIHNQAGGSNELGSEERTVSSTGTYNATATHTAQAGVCMLCALADTASTAAACRITLAGQTYNTTSGTHTVVATPAVGDLIVIVRSATGSTASTAPTDNNSSGTYTLAVSVLRNTSADILEIWVRNALIGAASSTTFTEAPGTTTGGGLTVYRVSGMTKTGSAAIKQVASQANQAANGTPAPTFGATTSALNPIFTAVANATSFSGGAYTVGPNGFVNDIMKGYSTPTSAIRGAWAEGGIAATAMTWTAQSASVWGSVALELDSSAASGTPTNLFFF